MRFLVNRRFGSCEELIEIFSDIEGISLQYFEEWSTPSSHCFETKDELILPILQAGCLMVGNDKIEVESCPILYASTEIGDELDPSVVIRVVQRISNVTLTSADTQKSSTLEFSCSPQFIPLVCSTKYKVQGKVVNFSTRQCNAVLEQSRTVDPVFHPPSLVGQSPAPHAILPPPVLSISSQPPPPYQYSPSSQCYQPYPPYPYHYGHMPDQFHPPSSSHHSQFHPSSHRPLCSIELFHDGENCPCTGSLNAVDVFETTIRLIVSRFLGDAYQADKFDIHANVQVKWNFVLSPDKISFTSSKFLADLETLGAIRIDPGKKSDAVDTSIKKLMDQYRVDYLTRSADVNKSRIAVLISGDRDFAESLKSLRLVGATVMLIYNSEYASRAFRAIISPDYVLGSWLSLVRSTSTINSQCDPSVNNTGGISQPSSDHTSTEPENNQLSECEWCRLSKGETWYHKDGICPCKPFHPSICSWCQINLNESLEHEERFCPNKPSRECLWCLQMLGKSLTHRSSCPNNITNPNKYRGKSPDTQCIWCINNGARLTNHSYFYCRCKPLGVHHCPYCYRVCGKVEFHTIYQCPNTPSLAEYTLPGTSSKKNPHVNEMSLKDQIFHLEIKIVKCQESFLGSAVKTEEKSLLSKLRQLYKTEHTLINQLRILELKTIPKINQSTPSVEPKNRQLPTYVSQMTSSFSSILPSSSSILPSSTQLPSVGDENNPSPPFLSTNPDLEKYQNLFRNELLFGEINEGEMLEEYDEGEGDDESIENHHRRRHNELELKEDGLSDAESQSTKKRKYEESEDGRGEILRISRRDHFYGDDGGNFNSNRSNNSRFSNHFQRQ